MSVLLVAGIGVFVAGLVVVAFGIPVKEFSFGDTLIVSGAVVSCTGLIMISLSVVVRELRVIAQGLRSGSIVVDRGDDLRVPASLVPESGKDVADGHPQPSNRAQTAGGSGADPAVTPSIPSPPPWQTEVSTRERPEARSAAATGVALSEPSSDTPSPPKPRRNLLFSSSLRKERERAAAGSSDLTAPGISPLAPATHTPDPEVSPPASFDDAWPRSERSRPEPDQNASAVRVLKSGVVDGMAYSLYSDGSIEAQMPEGMRRFASIDQLRAHLDQRP